MNEMNKRRLKAISQIKGKTAERFAATLKVARAEMIDLFDADDFVNMCNTFQDRIFDVNEMDNFRGSVMGDMGYDDTYPIPPILTKLLKLSEFHLIALSELCERFWYRSNENCVGVHTFLIQNGMISPPVKT